MWRSTGGSARRAGSGVAWSYPAPADPPEALAGEIRQMRSACGWDLFGGAIGQRFAYRSAGIDNALVELGNLHLGTKVVATRHAAITVTASSMLLNTTRWYLGSFHDTNKKAPAG